MGAFEQPDTYDHRIRTLVPGYDLLHEVTLSALTSELGADRAARVLVVGCGTGEGLIRLAASTRWALVGVDPSAGMLALAEERVRQAGLSDRIVLQEATLDTHVAERPYDAAVALLVGHLLPDDGRRQGLYVDLAARLDRGAPAVIAELGRGPYDQLDQLWVAGHVGWAERQGVAGAALNRLRERLQHDFTRLSPQRLRALLVSAGLEVQGDLFRAFDVHGLLVRRR